MSRLNRVRNARARSTVAWTRLRVWGRDSFNLIKSKRGPITLLVILVFAVGAGVWSLIYFWDWLRAEEISGDVVARESGSTTVRNIGFVVAGMFALPFAFWRSLVAQRQADTTQQSLLNERYQQGAEMLGSKVFSARLGGIYALSRLATECPEQYQVQVLQLLCSFARNPPEDKDVEISWVPDELEFRGLRTDVQEVMTAISDCHKSRLTFEGGANFELDLKGAELSGLQLENADLSGADLAGSDLCNAQLHGADLSGVKCWDTNLSCANLRCANLSGAFLGRTDFRDTRLRSATLSGAKFHADGPALLATNPTQPQLDQARADTDNPPTIGRMLDPETSERLVWHDKPLDGQT